MRIILMTEKGGVCKTSVAATTALRTAELGYRTLVLSSDQPISWQIALIWNWCMIQPFQGAFLDFLFWASKRAVETCGLFLEGFGTEPVYSRDSPFRPRGAIRC